MTINQLEQRVKELRSRPLLVVCRTTGGKYRTMSLQECVETGGAFLHVVADDLDALLAAELGENAQK